MDEFIDKIKEALEGDDVVLDISPGMERRAYFVRTAFKHELNKLVEQGYRIYYVPTSKPGLILPVTTPVLVKPNTPYSVAYAKRNSLTSIDGGI